MSSSKETAVQSTSLDVDPQEQSSTGFSSKSAVEHGAPEVVETNAEASAAGGEKKSWRSKFSYFMTKDFWFILTLGQILAICITGTNTLTTLLVDQGTSIPAFQTFFNYVLLNIIYTSFTWYRYGFRKWGRMVVKDGWKCMY